MLPARRVPESTAQAAPPHPAAETPYRRDVDGLRALAILPVLLFHAGAPHFTGGYVGVDVFFVISGFLITGIIAREIAGERFSIAAFYVRRAKRILPALFVVLAATLVAGLVLLAPSELRNLGTTTLSTALFASNVSLWREVDYFAAAAELKPLLMTWSLGIEEQFYIFWPLLLLLGWRLRRQHVVLGALLVGSFALAWWGVVRLPSAAFFLLPYRAWELLLGAALSLATQVRPPGELAAGNAIRHVASAIGFGAILVPVVVYGASTPFPGPTAIVPCAGAALLLWSGERAIVNRHVLATRPFVGTGLLSYSLYLWHWPLLSFARVVNLGALPAVWAVAAVAAAFVLSFLTWRFVERPFRRPSPLPRRTILLRFALGTATFAAIGAATWLSRGLPARFAPEVVRLDASREDWNPRRAACANQSSAPRLPVTACVTGPPGAPLAVLWGDSHADALAPGVQAWAARQGLGFAQVTTAGCPPLPGVHVVRGATVSSECEAFNAHALEYASHAAEVDVVVLAARWALYAETTRFGTETGPRVYLREANSHRTSKENSRRTFAAALRSVTERLAAHGKRVLLVGQVPELPASGPDCLMREAMPLHLEISCSVPSRDASARLAFSERVLREVRAAVPRVAMFSPASTLCGSDTCRVVDGDAPLYVDGNHLSRSGALFLSRALGEGPPR